MQKAKVELPFELSHTIVNARNHWSALFLINKPKLESLKTATA